jgi:membrane-associated phospholipid phosphatase
MGDFGTNSAVRRLVAVFNPVDFLIAFFLGILVIFVLAYSDLIPQWGRVVFLYSAIFAILVLVAFAPSARKSWRPLGWLHDFFPVGLIPILFNSLADVIPYLHSTGWDSRLIEADRLVFGVDPTVWLERFLHSAAVDVLQLAYTSYYFLPIILALVLYQNRDRRGFDETAFGVILGFFVSYCGYLLFPAVGPRYTLAHLQSQPIVGSPKIETIRKSIDQLEKNKWDAFPSGHTAVVLLVLYYARRYTPRAFVVYLPVVVALIASTVYLRYHYVVDVVAGSLLVPMVLPGASLSMRIWEKLQALVAMDELKTRSSPPRGQRLKEGVS